VEIQSGVYEPITRKRVTVWPKPDANGDGPEVYTDRTDAAGNPLGRDLVRDQAGAVVKEYLPPAGFTHVPTRSPGADDATGAYVRLDGRGNVLRDKDGNAIGIVPGSALVEHPDGTSVLLRDDYAHVLFGKAHTLVTPAEAAPESAPAPPSAPVPPTPVWPGV
jgi:hypothetical protein